MNNDSIHAIFEDVVERFPNNIAINEDTRSITYQQLNSCANRVAHVLKQIHSSRLRLIVGLYFESSIEYVVAMLGVLKAGAIFLPLDTTFPVKRQGSILEKSKPKIFITSASLQAEFTEKLNQISESVHADHMIVLDDDCNFNVKSLPAGIPATEEYSSHEENPELTTDLNDGCYIVTTSGSTGEPKSILGCHKGLCQHILWEIDEFGLDEYIRACVLPPVTFDANLRDILIPLCTGGTLCIPDEETRRNPAKLCKWLQDNKITILHIVPTLFRMLNRAMSDLGNCNNALPSLNKILIAGEVLYGIDIINWRKVNGNNAEIVNLYGPTETTIVKVFHRINTEDIVPNEIVPLGNPISDTRVLIIKDDEHCAIGETGEIYIKTPYMTNGYHSDAELTEISFVQNPLVTDRTDIVYKTGDYGRFMPDGNIRFDGRLDGQIKLNGIRIEIGEIEIVLSQHAQVRQVAVATRKDSSGSKYLVGYVVAEEGEKPTVESLRRFAAKKLPDYMIPAMFVYLETLPTTANGKLDRRAFPEPPKMEQAYYIFSDSELDPTADVNLT